MRSFIRISQMLNKAMYIIAGTSLVSILILTVADVIMRYLGRPIPGTYELVALGGGVAIGFALPYTSWTKAHIAVDMLLEKFPKWKSSLEVTTRILALILFVAFTWYLFSYATDLIKTGEGTLTLQVPLYPFVYSLTACCFVECIVFAADIARIVYLGGAYE